MGSIWLLVLIIVGAANGEITVKTKVHWSNDPSFNNEQMCNAAGKTLTEEFQKSIGPENGVVFWKCQEASIDDMIKGAGKTAPTEPPKADAPKSNGTAL